MLVPSLAADAAVTVIPAKAGDSVTTAVPDSAPTSVTGVPLRGNDRRCLLNSDYVSVS